MCTELKLLTMEEVARILRVHRSTISRLIASGALPALAIRSCTRVRGTDLRKFIDSQIGMSTGESSMER
ncbi:helix-turn-helix domain-containing protein [Desulfovibrio aminophilus]|uniref:helix-turn-helix domain-containing protein n=1 Tax=Desulfovibrio aminophilus TaxID=81425 RepID=UPI00146E0838